MRADAGRAAHEDGAGRCTVLHLDMDAFFAAVEVLDDPALAGKPVIVGGTGTRGVVASCTYEARAYGIHSAMSSVEARRRCPHAVFLAGRFWRYSEVSTRLHDVLSEFTPVVEPISLDEAFLDVAGAVRLLGSPPVIARRLRAAVRADLGLDCSVGVARTKLVAKLASEAAKPVAALSGTRPGPGVVVVLPEQELAFLHPLPVRALWGVGPATAKRLSALGIERVGELAAVPEESLCRALGRSHGAHLAALARGEDDRVVEADREAKSVGHEETFATDLHDHGALHPLAVRMADAVAARMAEAVVEARTVTVKVRFADRATITRSQTLETPTRSARVLREVAASLLEAVDVGPGVRLLGVSASGLSSSAAARQLRFDDVEGGTEPPGGGDPESRRGPDPAWEDLEAAVAAVRARYGDGAVAPAALVGRRGLDVKRRGDTQWGPPAPGDAGG